MRQIPHRVTSSGEFEQEGMTLELMNEWNRVYAGPAPMIIINGRAKASPTIEEVVAEYDRCKE